MQYVGQTCRFLKTRFSEHYRRTKKPREIDNYPPTKSEGYSFGVVRASVRPSIPSVRPEPYLSTYWSDLIHSWYK